MTYTKSEEAEVRSLVICRSAPRVWGELQLTDAIGADLVSTDVTGFRFEGERFDCRSIQGFVQATVAFAMDQPALGGDLSAFLGCFTMPLRHAAYRRRT
ncbi:hypothetical protein [Sulfitobacter sp. 915]|uniref:hypothetical protein n=1 Tax=Sulfitobacter sp. 915 TaxID=3368558 RepID=UPI0037457D23